MGFMDKIKNLFTEEVEEDEPVKPIKKEVIQVPIPAPEIKKAKVEVAEETKEEKFKFPVFDDKDFDTLEKPKTIEKKEPPKKEVYRETYRPAYKESYKREPYKASIEKKKFQPSPIISPVYGVLDKNYSKEDITPKRRTSYTIDSEENRPMTIDDVRKKLYGTLEDDLENTMFAPPSMFLEEEPPKVEEESTEDDFFRDLTEDDVVVKAEEQETKEEKEEDEFSFTQMDLELSRLTAHKEEDSNMIEDELNKLYETSTDQEITDSDLLQLIDTMYDEKKEGEI